jgi:hypothetical protein
VSSLTVCFSPHQGLGGSSGIALSGAGVLQGSITARERLFYRNGNGTHFGLPREEIYGGYPIGNLHTKK